jgi:hypothetical protein
MPSIREILKAQIASLGGDGLCYPGLNCSCSIDDLLPCLRRLSGEGPTLDACKVAKKGEDGLYYVMEGK